MRVRDLMNTAVHTVTPSDRLLDAALAMRDLHCRHMAVVDAGRLVGILSDRDVLLFATLDTGGEVVVDRQATVREAMRPDPLTVRSDAWLADAVALMRGHRVDALPVVDQPGVLAGIVTSADFLATLERLAGGDSGVRREAAPKDRLPSDAFG